MSEPDLDRVPDAGDGVPPDAGRMGTDLPPTHGHRLTLRCLAAGTILAAALCAINTYLTLRFGIIEEGAMISAIFFFSSIYFLSLAAGAANRAVACLTRHVSAVCRRPIVVRPVTTAEMVLVATMGSAGGSLAFIANFFAAKAMTSEPYSIVEMVLFAIVSSTIGVLSVIAFRYLLVVKDEELPEGRRLSWVGAKVVKGVIDPLVSRGDPRQPRYLVVVTSLAALYVLFNSSGAGLVPERLGVSVLGLSAFGASVLLAPFAIGSSYIMGFRTVVGFFCGGVVLIAIAPLLPPVMQASPQQYLWPGVMFLVSSGLTALALRWRVVTGALRSIAKAGEHAGADDDPIMGRRATLIVVAGGLLVAMTILHFAFSISLLIAVVMIAVGGGFLNLIATRAYAQTAFNPVRVMGVLLQGISASLGGATVAANLTAAGFIAGSGTQCSNLTSDMWYGRRYRVPSRWQFWAQAAMVLSCSVVSALTFAMIHRSTPLTFESEALAAPAAKMWAVIGLLFDPSTSQRLPPFAVEAMWIGGAVGVLWALAENSVAVGRFVPGSIGFGMGLVIHPSISLAFFGAGVLMWFLLRRVFAVSDATLSTIAIASIVGEGIGGLLQGVLKAVGVFG